jgi:hypothetical protein
MVAVYFTPVFDEIVSPYLKNMYHCGEVKIIDRIILFMFP